MEQNNEQTTMDINRIPNGAPVNVKLSKMVDGVFYIFAGVMEILRSLDPSEAKKFVSEFANEPDAADDASELANRVNARTAQNASMPAATDTSIVQKADTPTETPVEVKPTTSITVDDITKVIVAKIKQKRSNNEAIGALLKSYGVAKVSELPEVKYEAFITDLSQI